MKWKDKWSVQWEMDEEISYRSCLSLIKVGRKKNNHSQGRSESADHMEQWTSVFVLFHLKGKLEDRRMFALCVCGSKTMRKFQ